MLQPQLAMRQQHGEFGACETEERAAPIAQRLAVRQGFEVAFERALGFQLHHPLDEVIESPLAALLIEAERARLSLVVREHAACDLRRQLSKQPVTLFKRQMTRVGRTAG